MKKKVVCPHCGAECEYDTATTWEGNRDHEEYNCPDCGYLLDTALTDAVPVVRVITHGNKLPSKEEAK